MLIRRSFDLALSRASAVFSSISVHLHACLVAASRAAGTRHPADPFDDFPIRCRCSALVTAQRSRGTAVCTAPASALHAPHALGIAPSASLCPQRGPSAAQSERTRSHSPASTPGTTATEATAELARPLRSRIPSALPRPAALVQSLLHHPPCIQDQASAASPSFSAGVAGVASTRTMSARRVGRRTRR